MPAALNPNASTIPPCLCHNPPQLEPKKEEPKVRTLDNVTFFDWYWSWTPPAWSDWGVSWSP